MKKIISCFSLLFVLSFLCSGQTTSVTLQVTDTDAQTWNNGTWQAQLQPLTGSLTNINFKIIGTQNPVPNPNQFGALSPTGGASLTLTPNTVINPIGSMWNFTVCPQATAKCYSTLIFIFGSSQNVTIAPPGIRLNTTNVIPLAYTDGEVTLGLGQLYYNLILNNLRQCTQVICNGTGYSTLAGGGGSGCVVNPADGGCAIAGSPSVDLFIGSVGGGTGWLFQLLNSGLQLTVPLNVNSGNTAGVWSISCGPDPGVGSNISFTGPSGGCVPYTLYWPGTSTSGYLQCTNTANKLTCVYETAIDLSGSDVTNALNVTNGGTGAATKQAAINNLFNTPIRNGDLFGYWNGSAWNNFGGCTVSTCIFTENGAGNPGWLQTPLAVQYGGTGLVTQSSNIVYKGNGTGAEVVSSISDDGAKVAVTEPVRLVPVTFSTLPLCAAGTEGEHAAVTDSTTSTWGATITGSGANHVLAYCDGTNWTVAGK